MMKENKSTDMEFVELVLNEKDVDNLIPKLEKLKESRAHIHFNINDNNLLLHHEGDELN